MDVTQDAMHISTDEYKVLQALLEQYLPGTPAWVYGSRVKSTSTHKSDLDLVVFATHEQREAFEESDLLFRVDLFIWDDLPKVFQEEIREMHVALE